jgi:hypothetical protein
LLIVFPVVLLVLGAIGYFVAMKVGPESWRINGEGKIAYAALDELNMSVVTPITREDYERCLRTAVVKTAPYFQSRNVETCPKFADELARALLLYREVAERWNETVSSEGTTVRGVEGRYELRRIHVQWGWALAGQSLGNAKAIMDGKPENVHPISETMIRDFAAKEPAP